MPEVATWLEVPEGKGQPLAAHDTSTDLAALWVTSPIAEGLATPTDEGKEPRFVVVTGPCPWEPGSGAAWAVVTGASAAASGGASEKCDPVVTSQSMTCSYVCPGTSSSIGGIQHRTHH